MVAYASTGMISAAREVAFGITGDKQLHLG